MSSKSYLYITKGRGWYQVNRGYQGSLGIDILKRFKGKDAQKQAKAYAKEQAKPGEEIKESTMNSKQLIDEVVAGASPEELLEKVSYSYDIRLGQNSPTTVQADNITTNPVDEDDFGDDFDEDEENQEATTFDSPSLINYPLAGTRRWPRGSHEGKPQQDSHNSSTSPSVAESLIESVAQGEDPRRVVKYLGEGVLGEADPSKIEKQVNKLAKGADDVNVKAYSSSVDGYVLFSSAGPQKKFAAAIKKMFPKGSYKMHDDKEEGDYYVDLKVPLKESVDEAESKLSVGDKYLAKSRFEKASASVPAGMPFKIKDTMANGDYVISFLKGSGSAIAKRAALEKAVKSGSVVKESISEAKMPAKDQKKLMDFLKQGKHFVDEAKKIRDRIFALKGKPMSDVESRELQKLYGEQKRLQSATDKWLKQAETTYPDYDTFLSNAKKLGYKEKDLP